MIAAIHHRKLLRSSTARKAARISARSFVVHQGPARAFQLAHRPIAVDGYHQRVTQRARLFEITHVTDVQDVEDAVGENKLPARGAQTRAFSEKFISRKNLLWWTSANNLACEGLEEIAGASPFPTCEAFLN